MSELDGSDTPGGPGWWQGSDGRWYPPPRPGSDDPTRVVPEATAAMPPYEQVSGVPDDDDRGSGDRGIDNTTKGLIIGGVAVVVLVAVLLIFSATSGDDSEPTITIAPTTSTEPTTTERRSTTTERRPTTTEAPPATTEAPPTTESAPATATPPPTTQAAP